MSRCSVPPKATLNTWSLCRSRRSAAGVERMLSSPRTPTRRARVRRRDRGSKDPAPPGAETQARCPAPPVKSRPVRLIQHQIASTARSRSRTCGCGAKAARNHFSSFARIQVATFGIAEFATLPSHCKYQPHRCPKTIEPSNSAARSRQSRRSKRPSHARCRCAITTATSASR